MTDVLATSAPHLRTENPSYQPNQSIPNKRSTLNKTLKSVFQAHIDMTKDLIDRHKNLGPEERSGFYASDALADKALKALELQKSKSEKVQKKMEGRQHFKGIRNLLTSLKNFFSNLFSSKSYLRVVNPELLVSSIENVARNRPTGFQA